MRVGVDATCWHNRRGYGRYIRSLLRALIASDDRNHYTLLMDGTDRPEGLSTAADVQFVPASTPTIAAASADGRRSLRDMGRMSYALAAPQFDLLLFPTVYSYVPVPNRTRKLVMIMDVIAETHPTLTLPSRVARLCWNTKVALARCQADAFLTLSEHSQRGIVERFRVNPQRVFVLGGAADPVFRVTGDTEPTPYLHSQGIDTRYRWLAYVGGFSPHKNLEPLLHIFARLAERREFADLRLVLVGELETDVYYSHAATIQEKVHRLGIRNRVLFTGYLPDNELVVLLNLVSVLLLPSFLEGLGLPALEAAACGCPVIATTESPLPSLLGDAGLYVGPRDLAGWEHCILQVLRSKSLRKRMREAGIKAARRLTWDAVAQRLRGILENHASP